MKNLTYVCLTLSLFVSCNLLAAKSHTWTALLFMEPNENLHSAVWRNLNALLAADTTDNVTFCVQLRSYGKLGHRYLIQNHTLRFIDSVDLGDTVSDDLCHALTWAFGEHAANHHALIMWGNGYGPLSPTWNQEKREWDVEPDDAQTACAMCKRSGLNKAMTRTMLFRDESEQYLSNEGMIAAVCHGAQVINKKIDVLGLDVCLGAAIEHAYQIAPYVDTLVACQNCEFVDGFAYRGLLTKFSDSATTPARLVNSMITDYGSYYVHTMEKPVYTLSAIDCNHVRTAGVPALNAAVTALTDSIKKNPKLKELVMDTVRFECPHFCFVPMYTDLYSVFSTISQALHHAPDQIIAQAEQKKLVSLLAHAAESVKQAVLCNVAGEDMPQAHGVSVYIPFSHIDSTYPVTQFARDTEWLNLLEALIA